MRQRAASCRDRLDAPLFKDRAARAQWEVTDAERSPDLSGTDRPKALTARRITDGGGPRTRRPRCGGLLSYTGSGVVPHGAARRRRAALAALGEGHPQPGHSTVVVLDQPVHGELAFGADASPPVTAEAERGESLTA